MPNIYLLNQQKFDDAKNIATIKIEFKSPKIDLSGYDGLIFTSKNGVFGIDNIDKSWRDIPSYSIGSGTSKAIKELGGKVVYSAKNSYGDSFAKEIRSLLRGKKVLFLRAKSVTSKLNSILRDAGVLLDEIVIYETLCQDSKDIKKPKRGSIIIFSSPSTIECFFKALSWDSSYRAIVIGEVTASHMPKEINYLLSPHQDITSCIKLAKSLSEDQL